MINKNDAANTLKPSIMILSSFDETGVDKISLLLSSCGAEPVIVEICDLTHERVAAEDFSGLVIAGTSRYEKFFPGKLLATEIEYKNMVSGGMIKDRLKDFALSGKPVLGIGAGFHALIETGFLPDTKGVFEREASLLFQRHERKPAADTAELFIAAGASSRFTQGLQSFDIAASDLETVLAIKEKDVFENILSEKLNILSVPETDESGKTLNMRKFFETGCAALRNPRDNVFGTLWHPEDFAFEFAGTGLIKEGHGIKFLRNFVECAQKISQTK